MAKIETLTFSSLGAMFNSDGLYVLAYSWLFGMSIWVTFFGGIIALKTLPRHQFGALQHKMFPIYFVISAGLSAYLLAHHTWTHPDVLTYISHPTVADVAQAYALGSVLVFMVINRFVVGPLTSKVMFERHRLEKNEGKAWNDEGISNEMKALNARFGSLHGISSLFNLLSVFALVFHGLWIGSNVNGVKGY